MTVREAKEAVMAGLEFGGTNDQLEFTGRDFRSR
jgi:hypothetical protein